MRRTKKTVSGCGIVRLAYPKACCWGKYRFTVRQWITVIDVYFRGIHIAVCTIAKKVTSLLGAVISSRIHSTTGLWAILVHTNRKCSSLWIHTRTRVWHIPWWDRFTVCSWCFRTKGIAEWTTWLVADAPGFTSACICEYQLKYNTTFIEKYSKKNSE